MDGKLRRRRVQRTKSSQDGGHSSHVGKSRLNQWVEGIDQCLVEMGHGDFEVRGGTQCCEYVGGTEDVICVDTTFVDTASQGRSTQGVGVRVKRRINWGEAMIDVEAVFSEANCLRRHCRRSSTAGVLIHCKRTSGGGGGYRYGRMYDGPQPKLPSFFCFRKGEINKSSNGCNPVAAQAVRHSELSVTAHRSMYVMIPSDVLMLLCWHRKTSANSLPRIVFISLDHCHPVLPSDRNMSTKGGAHFSTLKSLVYALVNKNMPPEEIQKMVTFLLDNDRLTPLIAIIRRLPPEGQTRFLDRVNQVCRGRWLFFAGHIPSLLLQRRSVLLTQKLPSSTSLESSVGLFNVYQDLLCSPQGSRNAAIVLTPPRE